MHPDHLIILPIVIPLLSGAALLLVDDRRRMVKAVLALAAMCALLLVAVRLVMHAGAVAEVATYRLGNWDLPFAIVLVLDRLAALMVLLSALLGIVTHTFAMARWHRAGPFFHSLLLFLLAGLNGAFLTGDLFNLFVFLEVLLAASYGLVLHGSGTLRVRAGLHYIAINVAGAALLLIGISLLYGVTGTLNIADLAVRVPQLTGTARALAHAGAGILGIALLLKAGMWPLCFWLVPAYSAASAPVGAVFAIMTKVGIYTILRLWLPLFGAVPDAWSPLQGNWLLLGGLLTLTFGMIGVLAAQTLAHLAAYCVLVSSGTLLAIVATGNTAAVAGALFYLVSSTIAITTFFLLVELLERGRDPGADLLAITREAFGDDEDAADEEEEAGIVIPGSVAFLGMAFVGCALMLAGLPPLSGFLSKAAILHGLLQGDTNVPATTWLILGLLLASGLATMMTASRLGIRTIWMEFDRNAPPVALVEIIPVSLLLMVSAGLTIAAGPVMSYMEGTAELLSSPATYVEGVLGNAPPAHGTVPE